MKTAHIIAGGTVFHVRPHMALAAPAYGTVGYQLLEAFQNNENFDGVANLYTTKMAGDQYISYRIKDCTTNDLLPEEEPGKGLETNLDVSNLLEKLIKEAAPGTIFFMPVALCDFKVTSIDLTGHSMGERMDSSLPGKDLNRLKSDNYYALRLQGAQKIISEMRKVRKDIFVVGFKTTAGAEPKQQFEAGLELLKKSSINLVLANDIKTKKNLIITPEQAAYGDGRDRDEVLELLVNMALSRSGGRFTRSVVAQTDEKVHWDTKKIPQTLKTVVDWCVKKGAYKPFLGATVGHFAFKVDDTHFITSKRKTNFNDLDSVGMVLVETLDDNRVIAYGARPSVGGQSQRIIFKEHPEMDCIVHFHCPLKPGARLPIPIREQWPHECGSHECGQNTSRGLQRFELGRYNHNVSKLVGRNDMIKAVMLDKHGPNIVFNRDTDPLEIINFIDEHWDLSRSTSELGI